MIFHLVHRQYSMGHTHRVFHSRSFRYLSHWYGLREFLILSPKRNNDAITDEDRANLLLSSTAIAVSNVGW